VPAVRNVKTIKVNPRSVKSRDPFMVAIINGVTKAGTFRNHRKHNNKNACRGKETMPAAVIPHVSDSHNVVVDWERDNDLFRVYAAVNDYIDSPKHDVDVIVIHLLDDALQPAAVINTSMFTAEEWESIKDAAIEEYERQLE
jgi:hypothetical protein